MKKIFTLIITAAVISLCSQAQSFTAVYTFDSVKMNTSGLIDPSFVPVATGVTFGHFSAIGTSSNPNASGRFSFTAWPTGATSGNNLYSSLTGNLSATEYYEVTLTPSTGFTFTLSGITFKTRRSGTGVRTYAVRSSEDNYATNLPASISPANTNLSVQSGNVCFWNYDSIISEQNGNKITLSGSSFTNISSSVKFRFYAWNSEATSGTFSIDTVNFTGSSSAGSIAANFSADTVCFGDSTKFTDLSASGVGTITKWKWNFGDGSVVDSTQNPSHIYTTRGTKNVKLIVKDNLSNTDSITQTIFVDSVTASLTNNIIGNVVTFSGSASYGVSPYQTTIDFGDGTPTSTNINCTHTYTSNGTYTACLAVLDTNGCSDSSCVSITIIGTGINSSVTESISIYPNPSENGVFTVSTGSSSNKTVVTVYNIIGEVVFSKEVNSAGKQIIDLSNEPDGCYFVNFKNDTSTITRKITISK